MTGAASTARPIPADVTTSEHYATADDWRADQDAPVRQGRRGAGPGVPFFHGGGYIFGHIDLFEGPVSGYLSTSGVSFLSVTRSQPTTSCARAGARRAQAERTRRGVR
jgi:hypothetical protein